MAGERIQLMHPCNDYDRTDKLYLLNFTINLIEIKGTKNTKPREAVGARKLIHKSSEFLKISREIADG